MTQGLKTQKVIDELQLEEVTSFGFTYGFTCSKVIQSCRATKYEGVLVTVKFQGFIWM